MVHAPLEDNEAHANIVGFDAMGKTQPKRAQRELARLAVSVREPAGARTRTGKG